MRSPPAALLLLALAGCSPVQTSTDAAGLRTSFPAWAGEAPRDLIVVSIDTFQRARMQTYGDPVGMPFLDDLASRSARLDAHTSCSNWTYASVLCAQTGQSATTLGYVPSMGRTEPLPVAIETVASRLRDAGYRTALASANPLFSEEYGLAAGFDVAFTEHDLPLTELYAAVADQAPDGETPTYLHLHALEPHSPYAPPDAYLDGLAALPPIDFDLDTPLTYFTLDNQWLSLTEAEREAVTAHIELRYDAELRWLDDQLAEVFADLDASGALDDALVVIWSDHGEQLWERGALGHGRALYREEHDALAMFWSRGVAPLAWTAPTTHVDLAPTVLDALGVPLSDPVDGLPVGTAPSDRVLFDLSDGYTGVVQAVRDGDLRLHYWWTGTARLYDVRQDPAEAQDLYAPDDPRAQALWELLVPELERVAPLVDQQPTPPDP